MTQSFDDFKEYVSKVYPRDTAIKENYPLEELIEMYSDLYDEFKGVVSISFETWFATYRPSLETSAIEAEFIYEAGAQSRQADIDKLRKQLDLINQYTAAQGEAIKICNGERLELQKRIDNALRLINKDISEFGSSNYLDNAVNVLKGTTNEQ